MHDARLQRGFTLVELLVSMLILFILLGIAVAALKSTRNVAIDIACKSNMRAIGVFYYQYLAEHNDVWPTFQYDYDNAGVADLIHVPSWGDNDGWIILPINEVFFWAWKLRFYAGRDILRSVEALSCPAAHREFYYSYDSEPVSDISFDPMLIPQNSYRYSVSLFTRPRAWMQPAVRPDVNAVHSPVRNSRVLYPSRKAALAEANSFHSPRRAPLHLADREQFNVLAVDGHVQAIAPSNAMHPMGFIGEPTGLEVPSISSIEYAETGMPFVSTVKGAEGVDW